MSREIMQFFAFGNLRPAFSESSQLICELAGRLDEMLPDCAEKTAGFRKLLEAMDCFARTTIAAGRTSPAESSGHTKHEGR